MPFRDIVGHELVLSLVSRAALGGTLPPSLIFAGPAGVGKHMAAVALAQLVNCAAPVESARAGWDACGECAACRRIARRVHADVLFIEPGESGSIKIEQIREAIERSAYRPFEGRRRVVIINDADAIVAEAQNALLKTLEEPPSSSTFVLVTARPDTLLITVRSRCQRLRFGRLPPADVAHLLMTQHAYAEADAHAAASLSDGSVGRALEEGTESFVEARDAALRLLQTAAASNAPACPHPGSTCAAGRRPRQSSGPRCPGAIAGGAVIDTPGSRRARGQRRSSVACECRPEKAARESPSGVRQRAGPECIRQRRSRARRAAAKREPEDRR